MNNRTCRNGSGSSSSDNHRGHPVLRVFRKVLAGIVLISALTSMRAPAALLDCVCLRQQAFFALQTNQCVGVIPDLCPMATNCYFPSLPTSPGYTCLQTPAPGTVVSNSTPIFFTLIENITSNTAN